MASDVSTALKQLKEGQVPSPAETEAAQRSVQRLQRGSTELSKCDSQELMQLYVAMRRVKGEQARINAAMLLGWRQKHVQTTLLKQSFLVVPKRGREHLETDLKDYLVNPEDLPDLPVTFDPKESMLFDDSAPRQKLGLGVQVMELAAGTARDRQAGPQAPPPPSPALPQPALPDAQELPSGPLASQGSQIAVGRPARVLLERVSEELTEANAAETIAVSIKTCFENNRLHSEDPMAHNTVTFWLQKYQKHLVASVRAWKEASENNKDMADFVAKMDPHSQLVVKYVVRSLLDRDCFTSLAPFVSIFKSLQSDVPGFLPPLASAIIELATCDVSSLDAVAVGNDLSLTQQTTFFNSTMYGGFMTARACQQIAKLRSDHGAEAESRLTSVKRLLESDYLSAEQKKELEEVATLFGPSSFNAKALYLLTEPQRFALLTAWSPQNEALMNTKICVDTEVVWSDMKPAKLLSVASSIAPLKECCSLVANPVLRVLMDKLGKMMVYFPKEKHLQMVGERVFVELAHLKLAVPLPPEDFVLPAQEIIDEQKDNFQKLAAVLGSRDLQRQGPALDFLRSLLPPAEPKPDDSKQPSAPETAPAAEASQVDQPADAFKVGDRVLISVTRDKRKYDQCKGEITSVGAKYCKVTLLDGSEVGGSRQFMLANLKLLPSPSEAKVPPKDKKAEAKKLFPGLDDI